MADANERAEQPIPETRNEDGTLTRLYAMRLPEQTWRQIDAVAENQGRSTLALMSSIMPIWVKSYIQTWNGHVQAGRKSNG
jgi:hypothetical protein